MTEVQEVTMNREPASQSPKRSLRGIGKSLIRHIICFVVCQFFAGLVMFVVFGLLLPPAIARIWNGVPLVIAFLVTATLIYYWTFKLIREKRYSD